MRTPSLYYLCVPPWLVCLALCRLVLVDAMGTNELGFVRSGPLGAQLYPPSVSIVVPCYNCAEFVLLAFESFERSFDILHDLVLRLGTRPIECEVVVVDDKSADNSVALISRFLDPSGVWAGKACAECKHPPPKYTLLQHSVNQGAGVTRNDGVAAAHGQVILFGESDDVFYEHHAAVCWDMMRRYPNLAFIKMRMDAGKEYVESSFIAHQAPVQTLHPHWQVAIEDTSPMNLCVRKDAHNFIGGYPDGELFHMDMEDGAYMMCLYEAYAGLKWLSSPSTLYVRRVNNGLDRRMLQFTNEPGSVALGEQDSKYGDQRMDLIDGHLALVRDRLAEYQAVEELLALDPLDDQARELHRERAQAFGHAYGLPRPIYTTSNFPPRPPPVFAREADTERHTDNERDTDGDALAATAARSQHQFGGATAPKKKGVSPAADARYTDRYTDRYTQSEAHVVAVVYRGCKPRALRNLMASLVYRALINPLRLLLFVDHPYPQATAPPSPAGTCADMQQVAHLFPVHVQRFEGALVRASLAARCVVALAAAVQMSGGAGGVAAGKDFVLLFELAPEARASALPPPPPAPGAPAAATSATLAKSAPPAPPASAGAERRARVGKGTGADGVGSGGFVAPVRDGVEEEVDYCKLISSGLTAEQLPSLVRAPAARHVAAEEAQGTAVPAAKTRVFGGGDRGAASVEEEDGGARLGGNAGVSDVSDVSEAIAREYEHFWGPDSVSWPAPHPELSDPRVSHQADASESGDEGRGGWMSGGGWDRFKVLSSRSVSAAKVCGEVLRDKSTGEVRVDGHSNGRRGHRDASGSQMGCCVVRAM